MYQLLTFYGVLSQTILLIFSLKFSHLSVFLVLFLIPSSNYKTVFTDVYGSSMRSFHSMGIYPRHYSERQAFSSKIFLLRRFYLFFISHWSFLLFFHGISCEQNIPLRPESRAWMQTAINYGKRRLDHVSDFLFRRTVRGDGLLCLRDLVIESISPNSWPGIYLILGYTGIPV